MEEEEEHEGEVGGSKEEEGTEGDLSSRLRGVRRRAREDAVGMREDKDKRAQQVLAHQACPFLEAFPGFWCLKAGQ